MVFDDGVCGICENGCGGADHSASGMSCGRGLNVQPLVSIASASLLPRLIFTLCVEATFALFIGRMAMPGAGAAAAATTLAAAAWGGAATARVLAGIAEAVSNEKPRGRTTQRLPLALASSAVIAATAELAVTVHTLLVSGSRLLKSAQSSRLSFWPARSDPNATVNLT